MIAKPDWVFGLTAFVVIVASGVSILMSVRQAIASKSALPLAMESSSYASTEAAHFTFTNLNDVAGFMCVRGVVTAKSGGKQAFSVAVCTGELKPHSTITLQAPFRVGSVMDLCGDEPDRFGLQKVNWSKCTFDAVDLYGKTSP